MQQKGNPEFLAVRPSGSWRGNPHPPEIYCSPIPMAPFSRYFPDFSPGSRIIRDLVCKKRDIRLDLLGDIHHGLVATTLRCHQEGHRDTTTIVVVIRTAPLMGGAMWWNQTVVDVPPAQENPGEYLFLQTRSRMILDQAEIRKYLEKGAIGIGNKNFRWMRIRSP